jgi:hypothetical protein
MLAELQNSKNNFTLKSYTESSKKENEFVSDDVGAAYTEQLLADSNAEGKERAKPGGSGGTIYWDPYGTPIPTTNGIQSNGVTDLAHELFHALDANRGLLDDRNESGVKRSEWQAVYRENILRIQLGHPLRTHYIKKTDPSGNVLEGTGPRMINSGNAPILPPWYKA